MRVFLTFREEGVGGTKVIPSPVLGAKGVLTTWSSTPSQRNSGIVEQVGLPTVTGRSLVLRVTLIT